MANYMRIYAISVRELMAAPLPKRIEEPYRFGWLRAVRREPPSREGDVFDWAAREVEWAKDTVRLAEGSKTKSKERITG